MQYLKELQRQNRLDYWGAMPLVGLGMYEIGMMILFGGLMFLFPLLLSFGDTDFLLSIDEYGLSSEMIITAVDMIIQLFTVIGVTAAYAGLSYLLTRIVASVERRHVRQLLMQNEMLLSLAFTDGNRAAWPRAYAGCWAVNLTLDYTFLRSRQPQRGSLSESLNAFVNHFDAWCKSLRLRPHPLAVDVVWFLIAAIATIVVAALMYSQTLLIMRHASKASSSWFEFAVAVTVLVGSQLLFCTLPAGRRIGIRDALRDYFMAENPAPSGQLG